MHSDRKFRKDSKKSEGDESIAGLRIIGGSLRRRKLQYSGDPRTRPMKDRVREAVFNLLGTQVAGSHAIDLFAGTGALGIEAISRGATLGTFIERHFPTTKLIEQNAAALGIADKVQVVFGDAFGWSATFKSPPAARPLTVFCSPPFDFYVERQQQMLDLIARWLELSPAGSQIVVEADERFDMSLLPRPELWDVRKYPPAVVGIVSTEYSVLSTQYIQPFTPMSSSTTPLNPQHFADRLIAAVRIKRTPVLVGLDPRAESLPTGLIAGEGYEAAASGFASFCRGVIDVVAPLVPAVKPQAAFFEQLGPPGMRALKEVMDYAASKKLLVILDGKRNDIGTTAQGYAEAYLGSGAASPWGADALTVSPYLGDDSLTPFVEIAQQRGAGIFVLVKTSNPGGKRFQDIVAEGKPLYRHVADYVESLAAETAGSGGYGSVGAVVGATYPQQLAELRQAMPHTWLLIPGFGAQGGSANDCAAAFDQHGLGAIVNNSRGIIFAHSRPEYRDRFGPARWQQAVEAATLDMIAQLRAETAAQQL